MLACDGLVMEVTRRCNIRCDHCLRGEPQMIDMSRAVVDATLRQVNSVYHLTLTGGEPTLNLPIIDYIVQAFQKHEVGLESFYMATNGVNPSMAVIKTLINLYEICDDKEECRLEWSNDQYHEIMDCSEPEMYQILSIYGKKYSEEVKKKYGEGNIINEGRANWNGLSQHNHSLESIWLGEDEDGSGNLRLESTLYISANGNIMTDCDCAFERIDDECIGNILTDNLEEVLRGHAEEIH